MIRVCAVAAALLVVPPTAAAQKAAFVEAVIEFQVALSGTFGDEGPRVEAALDRMTDALEVWNAETRAARAALPSGPGGATSLARLLLEAGRQVGALEALDRALGLEPERADLHRLRGVLLDAAGRDEEALASFQRAWALDPGDPITTYRLADRMSAHEPYTPPERQMAALLAASRPASGASAAPFVRVALIDDTASAEPQFPRAAYADGFTALRIGRYEEAIGIFRSAMARDPLVADRVARSEPAAGAVAALRGDRVTDAVKGFEAAVAAAPSSSEAHRLLAGAHAAAGNVDVSVQEFQEAIRLAPDDERARIGLGRVLMAAGRSQDAERVLLDAIRLLPAAGRARWALADLYVATGQGVEAIEQLEQAAALTLIAGKAGLLWRLATVANQLQDESRVVSALARRARLIPNDASAHKSLGLAYHQAGRDVEALVELLMAARLGLEDGETAAVMGQIHLNAGRLTEAETVLRRAVALAPDSAAARYALARTLLRTGKDEEGQQHLAEFRRLQAMLLEERQQQYQRDLEKRNERLRGNEPGR